MEFMNKTAVITGAAMGIGRATAILMARGGANVVLVDMNSEKLQLIKEELKDCEDRILTIACDVSDMDAVNAAIAQVNERFGGVDILVNNAALWRCWASLLDTPIEDWKRFIDVNIMGVVYFTRAVLGQMIEKKYGRIINIASVAGVYGNANMAHYSATKGAVISFTKALAKEVTHLGITVNAVSPGSVSPARTPDINYYEDTDMAFIGRTGSPRENAELICFLASDKSSYISGQNIQIDGCRKKQ